jgi:hypothetical protein
VVVPVRAAWPSSSSSRTPAPTSREWLPWCCAIGQRPALGNLRALSSCRVANRMTSTVSKEYSSSALAIPSLCGTGWPGPWRGRIEETIRSGWRGALVYVLLLVVRSRTSCHGLASSLTSPSSCFIHLQTKQREENEGCHMRCQDCPFSVQFSLHETFPGDWTR